MKEVLAITVLLVLTGCGESGMDSATPTSESTASTDNTTPTSESTVPTDSPTPSNESSAPPVERDDFKMLVCETELTKEFIAEHSAGHRELCKEFGGDSCGSLKEKEAEMQVCIDSGSQYSHRFSVVFDMKSIEKGQGDAEIRVEACWLPGTQKVLNASIKTMPSILSFVVEGQHDIWNVDRETLRAGWNEERDFQCEIKEVEQKNRI